MFKKILAFCLMGSFLFAAGLPVSAEAAAPVAPSVSAKSAVVLDADTGHVLYAKDEHAKRAMASTTKIMTALLALEAAAVNDRVVTVTDEMVRVEGSSMGLKAGDQLTLKNIAAGMMAVSGNDAANTVAMAVGGSPTAFAAMMNARALELGMEDSHFVTPSGLDDEAHYSTALDMAKLAAAALKNADFAEIVGQQNIKVDYVSPAHSVRFTNHNKLLAQYEGCIGVKTGFTKKAGRCLVSAAERGGVRLVAVTLSAPDDWSDHRALLDYGFQLETRVSMADASYSVPLPITGGVSGTILVTGVDGEGFTVLNVDAQRVVRRVELPRFVYAPIRTGEVLGRVCYLLDGKLMASTQLTAGEDVYVKTNEAK